MLFAQKKPRGEFCEQNLFARGDGVGDFLR